MTVVVAFLCSDGAVVAADSMLTSSMGGLPVAHHTGRKVEVLAGQQVFAFAGDHGQGSRFKIMADGSYGQIAQTNHPIEYPLALSRSLVAQFQSTGIGNAVNLNTVVAFEHGNQHHCCVFEGLIQPRLLDAHHFYAALGSGKLSADPFIRFLVEVFCQAGPPNVREAVFLAAWTVEHAIHTSPGGVAGPMRIAVLERDDTGHYNAREVPDTEIEEHRQAIESAAQALRDWRDAIQTGKAALDVPPPPRGPGDYEIETGNPITS